MAIVTPRTCGGFAESGRIDAGPLSFEILSVASQSFDSSKAVAETAAPTTLWASSLDGEPLVSSRRILLVHLTDVQGDGAQFADERRQILLQWGRGPLVRVGAADVELNMSTNIQKLPMSANANGEQMEFDGNPFTVFALDTAGHRVGEVPATFERGVLRFRASTAGPNGGCIFYEITR